MCFCLNISKIPQMDKDLEEYFIDEEGTQNVLN